MQAQANILCAILVLAAVSQPVDGRAQSPRARFPNNTGSGKPSSVAFQGGSAAPYGQTGAAAPSATVPSTTTTPLTPITPAPSPGVGGSATLGPPSFDPYATTPGFADSPPSLFPSQSTTPYSTTPNFTPPPTVPYGGYGAPGIGAQAPPALFPGGLCGPAGCGLPGAAPVGALRLVQGVHFSHTWLAGDEGFEVDINDSVISVPLAYPNFAFTGQPVIVAPTFALHLWDGPSPPSTADLPGQAYSAYLDVSWQSDPNRYFGVELGTRVGVFSDFETASVDSIRTQGLALVRTRLTPATTLRAGALYLDRNDIKILPAGGILWEPNPQTKFDIFFPRPKLAQYFTTLGTQDIWWYVAGEYGGGAWTIEREAGFEDQIDINDIRLILGLEWGPPYKFQQNARTGFFEVGYVGARELVYVETPTQSIDLNDTYMLRAGFEY